VCAFQIFESTSSCSKFVESTCINRRVGFSLKYCSLLRSGEMHGQMHPQMPSFGFFQSCRSVMPFPLQSFFLSSKLSSGNRFAVTKQREACAKKRKITEPAKMDFENKQECSATDKYCRCVPHARIGTRGCTCLLLSDRSLSFKGERHLFYMANLPVSGYRVRGSWRYAYFSFCWSDL